jgi:hypothetical protein
VVTVLCGGAVTAFYFSPAKAGSNAPPANPTNPIVAVPAGHAGHPGHPGSALGAEHCSAPLPVVPEANPGLALIPVMAAALFFSTRRLLARAAVDAAGQKESR